MRTKRVPHNKNKVIGPKKSFTPGQVDRLKEKLSNMGKIKELALFSFAVDSALKTKRIFELKVKDVLDVDDDVKTEIILSGSVNKIIISDSTAEAINRMILNENKDKDNFLFVANDKRYQSGLREKGMSISYYRDLVKEWCEYLHLNPENYSTHSIRKTKKNNENFIYIESADHLDGENLSLEFKDWFDIKSNEGKATLIKSAIAMRNNNGGVIHIGYMNNKGFGIPNVGEHKGNKWVMEEYTQDDIQHLISKYASEKFDIILSYLPDKKHNLLYPKLRILNGVKTPVISILEIEATKTEEVSKSSKRDKPLKQYTSYVRSLDANGFVSTTKIQNMRDYEKLMKTCFDNREYEVSKVTNLIKRIFKSLNLNTNTDEETKS